MANQKKTTPENTPNIDSRALISPGARISAGTVIGPYALVGPDANIGEGTILEPFAQVTGHTTIGKNCRIFSYAVVGNISQDLKYQAGDISFVDIGDNNTIREFVTINAGTQSGSRTRIGDNNLFMAYSHIAHDCCVGDGNVFANNATLAGHVTVGNKSVIGGLSAVHQFCRIGNHAIIGGCSKVVQDVPPYSMCDGHPAIVCGLNIIGLKRAGFNTAIVSPLKKAFKILFFDGHPLAAAQDIIEKNLPALPEINALVSFVATSKRGIGR